MVSYVSSKPTSLPLNTAEMETEIVCVTASNLNPKVVQWLVPDLIPIGTGSVICGPAGGGKSTIGGDFVARGTRGLPWPDAENTIGAFDVVMLVSEEDLESAVVPRLIVAGADLDRVHFALQTKIRKGAGEFERDIALDTDMAAVEKLLTTYPETKWIIVDPLAGYLGNVKKNDDEKIRRILTAAKNIAERRLIASTTIDHFNKNFQQDAILRLSGAGALVQVPRIVWGVIADKDDPEHRSKLMLPIKANILSDGKKIGRRFRTENVDLPIEGQGIAHIGKVAWLGKCTEEINELLQQDNNPKEKRRHKAARFLEDFLATGAQKSDDIEAAAAKKKISRGALWEAKEDLKIHASKLGSAWWWELQKGDSSL